VDSWVAAWNAYHRISTRRRILKETFLQASQADRALLVVMAILFAASAIVYFCCAVWGFDHALWALAAMGTSEIALLIRLDRFRESWVSTEFGASGAIMKSPDIANHRDTRYLLFKAGLAKAGVFERQLKDCIELVDLQIDMASTEGGPQKKFTGFMLGVLSGVLSTALHSDKLNAILFNIVVILMLAWLMSEVLSWFPSRLEKMKEMKYFLILYRRELANNPADQLGEIRVLPPLI